MSRQLGFFLFEQRLIRWFFWRRAHFFQDFVQSSEIAFFSLFENRNFRDYTHFWIQFICIEENRRVIFVLESILVSR